MGVFVTLCGFVLVFVYLCILVFVYRSQCISACLSLHGLCDMFVCHCVSVSFLFICLCVCVFLYVCLCPSLWVYLYMSISAGPAEYVCPVSVSASDFRCDSVCDGVSMRLYLCV